jgi:hypothetical protein
MRMIEKCLDFCCTHILEVMLVVVGLLFALGVVLETDCVSDSV